MKRNEVVGHQLSKRSLLALIAVAALMGIRVEKPHVAHIPRDYLEELKNRSALGDKGGPYEFDTAVTGRYLARENDAGADVSRAILELYGNERRPSPEISPDLQEEQIYTLLESSDNGRRLSREERKAIVVLSNWWPETYAPFYRNSRGTRAELLERLRAYPSLQRAFARFGRPIQTEVAEREAGVRD